MSRHLLAALLLLLLAAGSAHAELVINKYTNDFAISSPYNEQLKLCSCQTQVDRIIVENTGNFYADFHVEVQAGFPGQLRIVPEDFQLAPKHLREVLVYIDGTCGMAGTFDYDVTVTNSFGRTERIHRTIRIDPCQTTALDVTPEALTVGLCQPATYEVTVENVGTYPDDYGLSFGPYDSVAQVRERFMRLEPGERLTQNVTFRFPCTEFGERSIPFTARSHSGDGAAAERTLTITNDYAFALGVPTSVEACAQTSTHVPVTISNDASVPDEIVLDIDAPGFVSVVGGERAVQLPAAGNASIALAIAPGRNDIGQHPITITARDTLGGVTHTRTATLSVANCYSVAAEVRIDPVTAAQSLSACCGTRTLYANIRNTGDREQVFQVMLDGPSIFTLEETTVRLQPNQNVNIPIRADLPCTDEEYAFSVLAWPAGQPQVNSSASFAVNSATQRTCHQVQIDEDELVMRETHGVLPVIVKHTGIEGGNYSIALNSTILRVLEGHVALEPGEQKTIHLVPIVNLTEAEKGRYIVHPAFTLVMPQELEYIESVGVELRGKGLWASLRDWLAGLPWEIVGACGWIILVLLLLLIAAIVMLLAMYGGWAPFGEMPRSTLAAVRTVLLALMLLLLVSMAFLRFPGEELRYERVAQGTNATVIEMYQNTEATIDLDRYFDDPDMDDLTYVSTQPQNINVEIRDSMMTLRPEHNFAGENTMVITASDAKGGLADSPVFLIRVIPQRQLGFFGWLNVWCGFIIVLLLIAILGTLFLMTLTVRERRPAAFQRQNVIRVVAPPTRRIVRTAKARRAAPVKRSTGRPSRKAAVVASRALSRPVVAKPVAVQRAQPLGSVSTVRSEGQTVNIAVGQPVAAAGREELALVASKTGNTVHTPYCMIARQIPKGKRIAFSSKREAMNAGLVPCKACRPF